MDAAAAEHTSSSISATGAAATDAAVAAEAVPKGNEVISALSGPSLQEKVEKVRCRTFHQIASLASEDGAEGSQQQHHSMAFVIFLQI
mmetsp:Transcript_36517/g.76281  ORF Transcript_36517/g.76281 Transcript_36517/m.76281 type:complete len:88 (-) Transcript_36517:93-356(-)